MRIDLDTLKCVKLLVNSGIEQPQAEGFIASLAEFNIRNLYDKSEINDMLNEKVLQAYQKFDDRTNRMENRLSNRTDRMENGMNKRFEELRRELLQEVRTGRRWIIGIIISIGLALMGYLSALIHLTH